jgi:hypothetical protein
MPTLLIRPGAMFNVYGWGNKQYCELVEFLNTLKQTNPSEYDKIWSRINRTADHGRINNPQQCRPLEGDHATGLFELKTSGGVRVAWFYDKDRIIVCTHAFGKCSAKELKIEIKKAQSIRIAYFKEKQDE